MKIFQTKIIMLLTASLWAGAASARPMLDQENDGLAGGPGSRGNGFVQGGFDIDRAQTFTVGLEGTLSDIEIQVRREADTTGDLFWDLRTLSAGAPSDANAGANILASGSLAASNFGTVDGAFVSLGGLSLNVGVGDMFAIVLRSDDATSGAYRWLTEFGEDSYAGGVAFDRFPTSGNIWEEDPGRFVDMGFRTYVDTGPVVEPVPIPATLPLVGLAMTLLGLSRRKARS